MPEYSVTYAIEVDGCSIIDAIENTKSSMMRPGTDATVWQVNNRLIDTKVGQSMESVQDALAAGETVYWSNFGYTVSPCGKMIMCGDRVVHGLHEDFLSGLFTAKAV